MKLVIFSDIHGNSYALDAFLKDLIGINYDYLVFCGDIFGYYYNQKEIITKLKDINNLIWLKGNHDKYFVDIYRHNINKSYYVKNYGHSYDNIFEEYKEEDVDFVDSLPDHYILSDNNKLIGIFHGTPDDYLEGRLYPDNKVNDFSLYNIYDLVILGHTHCRMCRKIDDTTIINSGSLGQPRDGTGYGYMLYDTGNEKFEFRNIKISVSQLYDQIDQYDKDLDKLKKVLERGENL